MRAVATSAKENAQQRKGHSCAVVFHDLGMVTALLMIKMRDQHHAELCCMSQRMGYARTAVASFLFRHRSNDAPLSLIALLPLSLRNESAAVTKAKLPLQ